VKSALDGSELYFFYDSPFDNSRLLKKLTCTRK